MSRVGENPFLTAWLAGGAQGQNAAQHADQSAMQHRDFLYQRVRDQAVDEANRKDFELRREESSHRMRRADQEFKIQQEERERMREVGRRVNMLTTAQFGKAAQSMFGVDIFSTPEGQELARLSGEPDVPPEIVSNLGSQMMQNYAMSPMIQARNNEIARIQKEIDTLEGMGGFPEANDPISRQVREKRDALLTRLAMLQGASTAKDIHSVLKGEAEFAQRREIEQIKAQARDPSMLDTEHLIVAINKISDRLSEDDYSNDEEGQALKRDDAAMLASLRAEYRTRFKTSDAPPPSPSAKILTPAEAAARAIQKAQQLQGN